MSEEQVKNLQNQVTQLIQTVNMRVAEVDAGKEMMGEVVQQCLNLRTNWKMLNKQLQEALGKHQAYEKQIESLNQQLTDATKRITELENPQAKDVQPDLAA